MGHNKITQAVQCIDSGAYEQAISLLGRLQKKLPTDSRIPYLLGVAHHRQGSLSHADRFYTQALRLDPPFVDARLQAAQVKVQLDNAAASVSLLQRGISLVADPAQADQRLYLHLGIAQLLNAQAQAAIETLSAYLKRHPVDLTAQLNLGNAYVGAHELVLAERCFARALAQSSTLVEAHIGIANVFAAKRNFERAEQALRQALALEPDNAEVHYNLGVLAKDLGKYVQARDAFQACVARAPMHLLGAKALADAHLELGEIEQGLSDLYRLQALEPNNLRTLSHCLFCTNYDSNLSPQQGYDFHRRLGNSFGKKIRPPARDKKKVLRIGFVSADFRRHNIPDFVVGLFNNLDRSCFEVYAYANSGRFDEYSAAVRDSVDRWLNISQLSDTQAKGQIEADGIDILVDLCGHKPGNRMQMFAMRAAPVQLSWLTINSTGIASIDYRLVDSLTDPADGLMREIPVRLTSGHHGFSPLSAPSTAPSHWSNDAPLVLGSFSVMPKLNDNVIRLWAEILNRVPHARLLVKDKIFTDPQAVLHFENRMRCQGIGANRLDLIGSIESSADYYEAVRRCSICLDPFPYNGVATTCDSLWMGTPVVTLLGDRHAARVGASLLSQVGLSELVASSTAEYVEIAINLANDPGRLGEMKRNLAATMRNSGLGDGRGFALRFGLSLKHLWALAP
ncbi:MAG: protein O-GlcNAc transferase [Motiliproteus sp.]|jgi:protein O-GlcNAc transferase